MSTNTDNLFDDLLEQVDEPTEATTEETAAESAPAEGTASTESEEPTRETVTVQSADNLPEGYVDVKNFAWALTTRNLAAAQADGRDVGPECMVDTQAVYAATRGKRWSLPAVEAVTADGTKLGIIIPLQEGMKAWDERPERGSGSGSSGMTPERRERRILIAGKWKARFVAMQEDYNRRTKLLSEVGATWDDADRAYNEWLETEDGKKEIADTPKDSE